MGRFFMGSNCHDDMLGNDGQLKLRYRYLPKEELEQISKSLYEAEQSSVKREPAVLDGPKVLSKGGKIILKYPYYSHQHMPWERR